MAGRALEALQRAPAAGASARGGTGTSGRAAAQSPASPAHSQQQQRDQNSRLPARRCQGCGAAAAPGCPLHRCRRCLGPSYCGGACQRADWPRHKAACQGSAGDQERMPAAPAAPAPSLAARAVVELRALFTRAAAGAGAACPRAAVWARCGWPGWAGARLGPGRVELLRTGREAGKQGGGSGEGEKRRQGEEAVWRRRRETEERQKNNRGARAHKAARSGGGSHRRHARARPPRLRPARPRPPHHTTWYPAVASRRLLPKRTGSPLDRLPTVSTSMSHIVLLVEKDTSIG
jgi:hypothetical protein